MSPRKVRRRYVRHLIVWGSLLLPLLVLGFIWPLVWLVVALLLVVPALIFGVLFIICTVIAAGHFLSTGYWTNPLRHGPWGDWKGEF